MNKFINLLIIKTVMLNKSNEKYGDASFIISLNSLFIIIITIINFGGIFYLFYFFPFFIFLFLLILSILSVVFGYKQRKIKHTILGDIGFYFGILNFLIFGLIITLFFIINL